ncbi:MAG: biotin/lipoate A/B protein ligase family protein [Deltaproteobacteria bacterium]|nr:biotin/lipoate A/B protein ligase family protein [Deltaproteobacteria bacterium]
MERWRLILDPDRQGPENMAKDEAILRAAESGSLIPTLRMYGWAGPAISIGYVQNPSHLLGFGLPVVRRITGGRAVLHDNELTYSIIVPSSNPLFSEGITGAYSAISGCIVKALKDIGIGASFSRGSKKGRTEQKDGCFFSASRYEILVEGKKLVGSSQRRFKQAFLQHGSILFGVNTGLNTRIFGKGAGQRMSWIGAYSDVSRDDFKNMLVKRISEGLGASFAQGALNESEQYLKDSLLKAKYSSSQWNHSCARRFQDAPLTVPAKEE